MIGKNLHVGIASGMKYLEVLERLCAVVCEIGTVSKISDCQPEGPGFKPRPGRGLNFRRPSFATPSVDREVKPLV